MNKGYILITSTIILSLIMLLIAVVLGTVTLLSRFGTVDFGNKKASFFAAWSCLERARFKLAEDVSYAGDEIVVVGDHQCSLLPIESSGPNKIIKAHSLVNAAASNLELTVNSLTLEAANFKEVVKF